MRFHWRLVQRGEKQLMTRSLREERFETALPDLETQVKFCHKAEESGIDSLLVDINFATPDPMMLAGALASRTRKIKLIVAVRSGLISPTLFVQQVNTFSSLYGDRISLNVVAGHSPDEQRCYGDFLDHDTRYERTREFLDICRRLWRREEVNFEGKYFRIEGGRLNTPFVSSQRDHPETLVAGGSEAACALALEHGDCWMRLADAPSALAPSLGPALQCGREVGLRLSVVAGRTRTEALEAAHALVEQTTLQKKEAVTEQRFVSASDSRSIAAVYRSAEKEWLAPCLWTGMVRSHGAPAIALVGSYDEIATALLEYGSLGVTQFIISGWPKLDSMVCFGAEILPRVRAKEHKELVHA
ncbi:MAG TPA: LLM class flavin-dependent oxidoreductase [Candidatus Angelobacter sp.]|jgi:alkanesulfonate monooxygenase|nr:LLM class flavin-dependent oxidoreductase [Candidatus Angelobacter sp.]